jgi:hypothetical protein
MSSPNLAQATHQTIKRRSRLLSTVISSESSNTVNTALKLILKTSVTTIWSQTLKPSPEKLTAGRIPEPTWPRRPRRPRR